MIRDLLLKDVRDHLLSLRFQVGLALALVLVSVSAFVLSTQYQRERADYERRVSQEDAFLRQYAHVNRLGPIVRAWRPPSSAVILRGLPTEVGVESLDQNPLGELFPSMDFAAIVAIVFSLLGIVIGFDAINGEKEQGTLRLVLTNRVRRAEIVLAKWAAGVLVLGVSLLASLAAGLLIVQVRAGVQWAWADWGAMGMAGAAALAYIVVFFSLALAASALVWRSSVSVLVSLLCWVLLVLVVPSLAPYIAAQIVPLPSVAALQRDLAYITSEERDEVGRALSNEVRRKYGFSEMDLGEKEVRQRVATDAAFKDLYARYRAESEAAWGEANRRQSVKARRLSEAWNGKAAQQSDLSLTLACLSPLPPLLLATSELSLNGFGSLENYRQQAGAWGASFGAYVRSRFAETQRADPTFDVNDFIDVSGRPRFVYGPPGLADRMSAASGSFIALGIWNAVLLALALAMFQRFDPR